MTHLESLTKKLHALLPELTELTRGCVFTYKDELMVYIGRSRHGFVQAIHSDCFLWDTATQKDPEELVKEFKILGHPITLEHVMKALSLLGLSKDGWTFGAGVDGGFVRIRSSAWQEEDLLPHNIASDLARGVWEDCPNSSWVLGLPLHKQSPEVHEFLDNLLPAHMSEPQKHD